MRVSDLNKSSMGYDPFLVDALGLSKTKKTSSIDDLKQITEKPTSWQKDILLTALDKLESGLAAKESDTLSLNSAPPLENFQEALKELKSLVDNNFKEYASQAQSNLTPQDILYLFEDEYNFTA